MPDFRLILSLKLSRFLLLDVEKDVLPNTGTGIIWENNGQPPTILQRNRINADEERLLGWHASDDDNLLTVCLSLFIQNMYTLIILA